MSQVGNVPVVHNDKAIGDLFFTDGGFSFSDDAAAYRRFSQKLSKLIDRPVVVVNLGDLPHAYVQQTDIPIKIKDRFTPVQLADRREALEAICEATLPDQNPEEAWRKFDLVGHTAANAGPNAGTLAGDGKPNGNEKSVLSPRMGGEFWQQAAIILVPDRRWSDKSMWSLRTGLDEGKVVKYPKGEGAKFVSFLHELSHLLQSGAAVNADTPASVTWAKEKDADIGAIDYATILANDRRAPPALARSLNEAIGMEAPVRALSRFLTTPDYYGTALAIDSHIRGEKEPTFARVHEIDTELRWRAYAHNVVPNVQPRDSQVVQNTVRAFYTHSLQDPTLNDPINDACNCSVAPPAHGAALSALRAVMRDSITDPQTRRVGELVLQAADFFSPPPAKLVHRAKTEVTAFPLPSSYPNQTSVPATYIPSEPTRSLPAMAARGIAY